MRALGVDLGQRRIGIAISDPEGTFAFPLSAVASGGLARDVKALASVASARDVDRIVIGLPLHMDGRKGPEALAAERFATALAKASGLPVDTLDERWTSLEADRALRASGTRRGRQKSRKTGELDSMAAAIILRTWLERARGEADLSDPPTTTEDPTRS